MVSRLKASDNNSLKKIIIIGAGNVGSNLASALYKNSISIHQICDLDINKSKNIADKFNSSYTNDIKKIEPNADLYIIAVSDDSIKSVLNNLTISEHSIVVHTSGSTSCSIFETTFNNYGVFYPLQTFDVNRDVDFSNIPICIEGSSDIVSETLAQLAKLLTDKVFFIDSDNRKIIHLSAVFVSNFVNFMYVIANDILSENKLSFEILKPLILESALKVQKNNPSNVQTGPAIRNDFSTINNHLELLNSNEDMKVVYSLLTEQIIKYYSK